MACIRDLRVEFLRAPLEMLSCLLHTVVDAGMAEALALRDGFLLADQARCSKMIVNSDCWEVIAKMKDGGNSLGAAAVYEECSFLARGFTRVIFYHSARGSNRVCS